MVKKKAKFQNYDDFMFFIVFKQYIDHIIFYGLDISVYSVIATLIELKVNPKRILVIYPKYDSVSFCQNVAKLNLTRY